MICDTCRDSPKPGHVFRPQPGVRHWEAAYEPCPECNGTGKQHCCEGLQAQPEETAQ